MPAQRISSALSLLVFALLTACTHPLAIIGEGDITERHGGIRGCTYEEFLANNPHCVNNFVIDSDYLVSYEATARPGWEFVEWQGTPCSGGSAPPYCDFNIPQSVVDQFTTITFPPTIAVFERSAPALGDFRIDTSGGDIGFASSASLDNGRFVTCWSSHTVSSGWSILCRLFSNDGSPLTLEIPVQAGTTFEQAYPEVAGLAGGGFVLVWNASFDAGSTFVVQGRRYDGMGAAQGSVFQVNTPPVGFSALEKNIAALDSGGFVVVFSYYGLSPETGVYLRRYGATGVPVAPEFNVAMVDNNEIYPDVVGLPGSGYYVVWAATGGPPPEVSGQEYDSVDSPLGIVAISDPSAEELADPSIGNLSGGGIVVTWEAEEASPSSLKDVRVRFMPSRTVAGTQEIVPHEVTAGSQDSENAPSLTGNGNVLAVWDFDSNWPPGDTHARFFDNAGNPIAASFKVNEGSGVETYSSDVIPLVDGEAVVTWVESNGNVWGRRILDTDSDGTPDFGDPAPLDPNIPNCQVPQNVEFLAPINWVSQGAQTLISLSDEIKVAEFTTTSNSNYQGRVDFTAATGTERVQRRAWISSCPGGAPLADVLCDRTGTSSIPIPWNQQPAAPRCGLETNTTYFLNIQNINCQNSSCNVFRQLLNNGNP